MRSFTKACLLSFVFSVPVLGMGPQALAQLSLNPYPEGEEAVAATDLNEAFEADPAIVQELLARKQERERAAGEAPVSLGAAHATKRAAQPAPAQASAPEYSNISVAPVPDSQEPEVSPAMKVVKKNLQKASKAEDAQLETAMPAEAEMPVLPVEVEEETAKVEKPIAPTKTKKSKKTVQPGDVVPGIQSAETMLRKAEVKSEPKPAVEAPAQETATVTKKEAYLSHAKVPASDGVSLDRVTIQVEPASQSYTRRRRVVPDEVPGAEAEMEMVAPADTPLMPEEAVEKAETVMPPAAQPAQVASQAEQAERTKPLPPLPVPSNAVRYQDTTDHVANQVDRLDSKASTQSADVQERRMIRSIIGDAGKIVGQRGDDRAELIVPQAAKGDVEDITLPIATQETAEFEADEVVIQLDETPISPSQALNSAVVAEAQPLPKTKVREPVGPELVYSEQNLQSVQDREGEQVSAAALTLPKMIKAPWQALKGDSAYDVLRIWSRNAGVDLIWNSEFLVDVYKPVSISGPYETAVQTLLDQYKGLNAGVHGVLYVDEKSGRKTLVVQTNGV